jgi:lipopolysaccharide transport system ATP-binding protein
MSDVVIRAEGLGKKYLIGHQAKRERYTALRDVVASAARGLARSGANLLRGRPIVAGDQVEEFWALKDVSFDVRPGEVVGIIGRNGAGKSTLLKILSRITEPSAGRLTIKGRVASLLEVGTGFHPELTGRENIYLNGAILGMTRAEIRRKFDEIIAFAEVEKFLDTPVKRYSSGMYVRLAFAVAAHLEPEILVVDEVLAVGDAEFQRKCLGKIGEVASGGRTVLFVSHNMGAVRQLCARTILLAKGGIALDTDAERATSHYLAVNTARTGQFTLSGRRFEPSEIAVSAGRIVLGDEPTGTIISGEPFAIELDTRAINRRSFSVEVLIRNARFEPIGFSPGGHHRSFAVSPDGSWSRIRVSIRNLDLAAGTYYVDLILVESGGRCFDYVENALEFQVAPEPMGPKGWIFRQSYEVGCVLLDAEYAVVPVKSQAA